MLRTTEKILFIRSTFPTHRRPAAAAIAAHSGPENTGKLA